MKRLLIISLFFMGCSTVTTSYQVGQCVSVGTDVYSILLADKAADHFQLEDASHNVYDLTYKQLSKFTIVSCN